MAVEFSRVITLLRKERGITQKQAAADLGISQAQLSHYENPMFLVVLIMKF